MLYMRPSLNYNI